MNDDGDLYDLTERIRYIEDKILPSVQETSFIEGQDGVTIPTGVEGEVNVVSALPQRPPTAESYVIAVDKFIQDTQGVRVRWGSDGGMMLRRRLDFAKNGNILLKKIYFRRRNG